VGWQGLLDRLKNEAPRYSQLLPELPRLLHQALQAPAQSAAGSAALVALLVEQRRTNRLLQGLVYGALGFIAGAVLVRAWLHWWPA
jgi:ubiquinone biosynthesis protein